MPRFAISDILVEAVWCWAVIGACLASIDSHRLSWISSGLDQGRGSDSCRLSWISSGLDQGRGSDSCRLSWISSGLDQGLAGVLIAVSCHLLVVG